jgi:hypothetical protein
MWILIRNFRCGPTQARLEMQTCPRPSPHVHMGCGYWISVKKSSSLRQNTLLWTNSIMQGIRGKVGDASSWTFPERPLMVWRCNVWTEDMASISIQQPCTSSVPRAALDHLWQSCCGPRFLNLDNLMILLGYSFCNQIFHVFRLHESLDFDKNWNHISLKKSIARVRQFGEVTNRQFDMTGLKNTEK